MANILVVDDTEAVLDSLGILLSKGRHNVHLAGDLESARWVLGEHAIDMVIIGSMVDPTDIRGLVRHVGEGDGATKMLLMASELAAREELERSDPSSWSHVHQLSTPVSAEQLLALVSDVEADVAKRGTVHDTRESKASSIPDQN